MPDTDHHLDEVTIRHLCWKPGIAREIGCKIVRAAVRSGEIWPDELDLDVDHADRNVIGTTWRMLAQQGILMPTGRFRRSEHEASKGRKIFHYSVASFALARTFLERNGAPVPKPKQAELTFA